MAKLSFKTDFAISEANINTASASLTADWATFSQPDKDTWKLTTQYVQNDPDGFHNYMDYFMRTFMSVNTNSVVYTSVTLQSGAITGYGGGGYGVGTWGTARSVIGSGNTFAERANRIWAVTVP